MTIPNVNDDIFNWSETYKVGMTLRAREALRRAWEYDRKKAFNLSEEVLRLSYLLKQANIYLDSLCAESENLK